MYVYGTRHREEIIDSAALYMSLGRLDDPDITHAAGPKIDLTLHTSALAMNFVFPAGCSGQYHIHRLYLDRFGLDVWCMLVTPPRNTKP